MCVNTVHVCACITKINFKVRVKLQVRYWIIMFHVKIFYIETSQIVMCRYRVGLYWSNIVNCFFPQAGGGGGAGG